MENIGINVYNLEFGNNFLETTLKSQSVKEIVVKLNWIEITKCSVLQKALSKKWDENSEYEKYFQKSFIIEDWYSTFINNLKFNKNIKRLIKNKKSP